MFPINHPEESSPTNKTAKKPAPTMLAETDTNRSIVVENLPRSSRSDGKNGKDHGVEAENGKGGTRGATIKLQAPPQVRVALDHGNEKASSATERDTPNQTGRLTGRGGMVAKETSGADSSANGHRPPPQDPPGAAQAETLDGLQDRVSTLEGQVQPSQVQDRSASDANLTEDPSVVAMQAAVHTLAQATEDFARTRGYDMGRISCDINALWAQPQVDGEGGGPTEIGPEQSFVQSFARSLVWTAWKRRRRS